MDAHPTIVLNDALLSVKPHLTKAGEALASALVEQLANEPHYAQFEISVTAKIINPETGQADGLAELKEPYEVYPDRNPYRPDGTE